MSPTLPDAAFTPAPATGLTALAEDYARLAVQGLDDAFGPGFAASHPALVAELVQAWLDMERLRQVQQALQGIRDAIAPLGVH